MQWVERRSDTQFALLLLAPTMLIMGVVALYPLLRTFYMSLHEDSLTGETFGEFIAFQNYQELLTGQRDVAMTRPFLPESPIAVSMSWPFVEMVNATGLFQAALTATLIFTLASVFFETVIGFGQALVLDQDFRGRRWARVAIILPWAVPIVIQGMIFYLLFQPAIGFLVDPMQQLGIFSSTPLINSVDSMIIIIVADVWKTSAFMALLILAGLQSVDRSLYSVAKVAGASRWQQFKHITLPIIFPMILVAMLFRTIGAMKVYGIIETVSSCSVVPSLSCMVVSTFGNNLYGTSAAVAFITAATIGSVVIVYLLKYSDKSQGAV